MLKIPLLVSLGHHGGRRKVASSRPPFSTPLRSLGEPDPETPFLAPIEHAPPLFVRIQEDKFPSDLPGSLILYESFEAECYPSSTISKVGGSPRQTPCTENPEPKRATRMKKITNPEPRTKECPYERPCIVPSAITQ